MHGHQQTGDAPNTGQFLGPNSTLAIGTLVPNSGNLTNGLFQSWQGITNPFDTSFGFANAAIGTFSSFAQASRYVEGTFTYNNTEFYVQDNWKASNQLTLDYGVRFVHAQPQYDSLLQSGNFLPDKCRPYRSQS